MNAPPWVPILRATVKAEWGVKACIITLATVDTDQRPRARSVICRGIRDDGILWIASDSRSAKNRQIRANPYGEAVFWLPGQREQFRVAGSLSVVHEGAGRLQAWHSLTDTARALFFWDPPGEDVRDDREIPGLVPATTPVPDSFEVLVLRPDRVEYLDLKAYPHARNVWEANTNWAVRSVNP